MPTLSKEQITEIELEMADLVEENKRLEEENKAIKAQLQRLMTDRSMSV